MGKRTIAITVHMSEEDYALIKRASEQLWPDAIMTDSARLLSLARRQAQITIQKKPRRS
jgi:hypothetical protein